MRGSLGPALETAAAMVDMEESQVSNCDFVAPFPPKMASLQTWALKVSGGINTQLRDNRLAAYVGCNCGHQLGQY